MSQMNTMPGHIPDYFHVHNDIWQLVKTISYARALPFACKF